MKEKINCAYTELVNIEKIIPNPKNPNKHTDDQIKRLSKIIDFQGQRSPVIISKRSGFIVVGHGRFEAMKKLGWNKVAVDYQDFENEAQEYAHMTADNAIAEWSTLNLDDIKADILEFEEFDFENLGLQNFTIGKFIEEDEEEQEADQNKKYILQVELPDELELRDLYDDLISKGYLVKEL